MPTTLKEKIRKVSPARRRKIAARTAELITEEMSLQELREAHRHTQKRVAAKLGIGQDGVSRLEKRTDILISTLRSYVEAMGGTLSIVAEFPHQRKVVISGLSTFDSTSTSDREAEAVHG